MKLKKITLKKIKTYTKHKIIEKVNNMQYRLKHINEDYNKVLHIWDTAGVASLLSRELRKHNYTSDVIMRTIHDPFGMTKYYGQESVDMEGIEYLTYCKKRAEGYGIIHIHSLYEIIPDFKKTFPKKKIILHFHGSELTNPKNDKDLVDCAIQADAIICATPDLESYVKKYHVLQKPYTCMNAVDTDLFKPIADVKKVPNKALYITIRYINLPLVKEYLKKHCEWEYDVLDRESNGVPFYDMPKIYNKYSRLIDIKIPIYNDDNKPIQAWSKTGLEALACGLQVFNHKNEIISGLPDLYKPETFCKSVIKVYEDVAQK